MYRLDDLFTQLEALREHECPRFPLQRRRLSLGGILAEGYDVTTTIRGVRCRFTAAEPAIRDVGFRVDPGDQFRMRFYTKATAVIARRWHATSMIKPLTYTTEFRITLPERP